MAFELRLEEEEEPPPLPPPPPRPQQPPQPVSHTGTPPAPVMVSQEDDGQAVDIPEPLFLPSQDALDSEGEDAGQHTEQTSSTMPFQLPPMPGTKQPVSSKKSVVQAAVTPLIAQATTPAEPHEGVPQPGIQSTPVAQVQSKLPATQDAADTKVRRLKCKVLYIYLVSPFP